MYKLENNVEWTDALKNAFKHNVTRAKIIYDKIGKISGTGENITLNGTANKKFRIPPLPRGNTTQTQYEGYNLLGLVDGTYTGGGITAVVNNGEVTLSGTGSGTPAILYIPLINPITISSNFYLYAFNKDSIGESSAGGNQNYVALRIGTNDNSNRSQISLDTINAKNSFTLSSEITITKCAIRSNANTTLNNNVIKPMLALSDNLDWESYCNGASPNPDYPQDINNVTGNAEVVVVGKNWTNVNTSHDYVSTNGVLNTGNAAYLGVSEKIKVSPNKQYTITFVDYPTGGNLIYGAYDKDGNWIKRVTVGSGQRTFTTDSDTFYVRPYLYSSALPYTIIGGNVQLELGNVSTAYVEYQGVQTLPLSLGNIELCKIGDYQDYIYKDNGKWYKYGAIGKVELNGTESGGWTLRETNTNTMRLTADGLSALNIVPYVSPYCNYFIGYASNAATSNIDVPCIAPRDNSSGFTVRFPVSLATTVNEFKSWLGINKPKVYYPLSTPTITEITDTTLKSQLEAIAEALSYEEQTNITGSSSEANPMFNVEAYTSTLIEINYDNGIKQITLEDNVYVPDLGFIGQAVAKKATLILLDNEQTTNFENTEFELYIGADYNNETYYIDYGRFIVNEAPENDSTNGTIKVIAYDYMIKFNKDYIDQVVYPCELKTLLASVCNQAGVELGSEEFLNNSFIVENNQFEGKNLREVLKHIAKCAFSWARVGQDNKLYLDFEVSETPVETLTINEYKQDAFKKANEYYGPINKVTYGDSDIKGQEESIADNADIEINGVKELVIYDNYFAYTTAKRQELVQAGTTLLGFSYMPVAQLDLIGTIYLDCNDVIEVEDEEGNSIITRVFSHTITYNGIVKDSIQTEGISDNQQTYQNINTPASNTSRTEIIVDRANKRIDSLVVDMYEEDGIVHENFTRVYQDMSNIINNVQNSGGINLIKNSVMFAYDEQGNPTDWELSSGGTLSISSSAEALSNGGISGHVFTLLNKTVKQKVTVKNDSDDIPEELKTYYTFSTKIKKDLTGTCYVKIYNTNEQYLITIPEGKSCFYEEFEINKLLPKENYYYIELYGSANSNATFTDNMLNIGEYKMQWQQASGEIMNTQVNINIDGVLVKSSIYNGDYTVMSPLEFAGYSNINGTITKIFTLNKDTTEVMKLKSTNEISMPPIKIVPITTGTMQGWAFVPIGGES